jgi:orotidine-5'-phosphate decarboxylase
MEFIEKLLAASRTNNSLLCVGLDPDVSKMENNGAVNKCVLFDFNKKIIDATSDLVCAYKPNTAFYEAFGESGIAQLKSTVDYIRSAYPHIPIIVDAKRADIGNTNTGSIDFVFSYLDADAVTVNPYMGKEALNPFLAEKDRGIIVLCRTSNVGSGEFQDLVVDGIPLYQRVAKNVVEHWNTNKNCLLVVGATYPEELREVRTIVGNEMIMLLPGVGAQGADIATALTSASNSSKSGVIINASRSVLYASSDSEYAVAARKVATKLRDEINRSRV